MSSSVWRFTVKMEQLLLEIVMPSFKWCGWLLNGWEFLYKRYLYVYEIWKDRSSEFCCLSEQLIRHIPIPLLSSISYIYVCTLNNEIICALLLRLEGVRASSVSYYETTTLCVVLNLTYVHSKIWSVNNEMHLQLLAERSAVFQTLYRSFRTLESWNSVRETKKWKNTAGVKETDTHGTLNLKGWRNSCRKKSKICRSRQLDDYY